MAGNSSLGAAKDAKNDEFYTRYRKCRRTHDFNRGI